MLRLHPSVIDYVILGIYFVVVLGCSLSISPPPLLDGRSPPRMRSSADYSTVCSISPSPSMAIRTLSPDCRNFGGS